LLRRLDGALVASGPKGSTGGPNHDPVDRGARTRRRSGSQCARRGVRDRRPRHRSHPSWRVKGDRMAERRGVSDRTTFRVGDGARAELPPADVVVLNRVFCCYPDIDALLENSLAAARSVYAFTTPPSTGFAGALARLLTRLSNVVYRLRD